MEKRGKKERWTEKEITSPSFTFGSVNRVSLVCESACPEVLKSQRHSKLLYGSFRHPRFMGFIKKFAINKFTVKTSTVNKSFGQSKTFLSPQISLIWPCLQHLACFHSYHLTLQVFETIPGTPHIKYFSLMCYNTLPQVLWHNYQCCVEVLDILWYRNWATTLYMVVKSWLKLLNHDIVLANQTLQAFKFYIRRNIFQYFINSCWLLLRQIPFSTFPQVSVYQFAFLMWIFTHAVCLI